MSTTPEDRGGDQRFSPTSGVLTGWIGVVLCAAGVALSLLTDHSINGVRFALAAGAFGVLVWSFMLRPRVVIGASSVELRNGLSSWHVPLAAVRRVQVRAVTRVSTEERRYDGVAVGRPVRSLAAGPRPARSRNRFIGLSLPDVTMIDPSAGDRQPRGQLNADMVADFVVEQILFAADNARAAGQPPEPARRSWAVPELVALTVLLAALAVTLAL